MIEKVIRSEEDCRRFGLCLAERLKPGDVVALIGDLGVGKTTLTKYMAQGLGISEMITSPTFTVVCEYRSGRLPLYHMDVYRLENAGDIFESGIEEYMDGEGVCIIEWADMVAEILPDDTICVFMEYGEKEGERIYRCAF